MRRIKRVFCVILALALLCGLGACGKAEPEPTTEAVAETTMEQTTEETTTEEPTTPRKHYEPPVPPEKPSDLICTPTYAVSKTHFYGVCSEYHENGRRTSSLRRVPLSDISKQEEIALPETHDGNDLKDAYICGLTKDWLFAGSTSDHIHFETYRISLTDLSMELLDFGEYDGAPWYNAANNSMLFLHRSNLKIEALLLDTGKRAVIWNEQWGNEWQDFRHWRNTANGLVALQYNPDGMSETTDIFVIDKDNRAVPMKYGDQKFPERKPVDEKRFWLEDILEEEGVWELIGFYTRDKNGRAKSITKVGTYDRGHGLESLGRLVLLTEYIIYGNSSGYFHTLYDPATGATFSSGT